MEVISALLGSRWRPSAPARAQFAAPPAARSKSGTVGPDSSQLTATLSRCTRGLISVPGLSWQWAEINISRG